MGKLPREHTRSESGFRRGAIVEQTDGTDPLLMDASETRVALVDARRSAARNRKELNASEAENERMLQRIRRLRNKIRDQEREILRLTAKVNFLETAAKRPNDAARCS